MGVGGRGRHRGRPGLKRPAAAACAGRPGRAGFGGLTLVAIALFPRRRREAQREEQEGHHAEDDAPDRAAAE